MYRHLSGGQQPRQSGRLWRIPLPRIQRGDCGGPSAAPPAADGNLCTAHRSGAPGAVRGRRGQVPRPISPENRLRLMKTRVAALPDEAKDLERQRRSICFAAAGAVLVCAVPCLVYLLDRRHFVSWDLEQVMGQMLLHVAPWVVAAFGVVLAAAYAWGRNVNREIAALKGHVGRETSEQPTSRRLPVGLLRRPVRGRHFVHRAGCDERRPAGCAGEGDQYLYGVYRPWVGSPAGFGIICPPSAD